MIEAYLELGRVRKRLKVLHDRLYNSILSLDNSDKNKIKLFKETVFDIEKNLKAYEELVVNIFKTLLLTKFEGNATLFEGVIKLFVLKERRNILEDLISLGNGLFGSKEERKIGLEAVDVIAQANAATGLIDKLEKALLTAGTKIDVIE